MRTDAPVTPADIAQLLKLLQEYTGKLRDICDAHSAARQRRSLFLRSAGGVMFAVAAIVLLSNDPATAGGSAFWVALSTIVVGAVGYLVADMCLYLGFRRAPFDAQQIAATVERLIRLCSQYGEHAAERVGDRFEFELRLAEAEGALRTYRELFRHEAVTGRFTTAA